MVPIQYNIRNLVQRKGTTLMTALGIGLAVAVLVIVLAMQAGLKGVFAETGDSRQLLVLRKGSDAELTSTLTNEAYQIIKTLPGIALTAKGDPMAAQEGVQVVNMTNDEYPDGMNLTVRGLQEVGIAMRDVTIEKGRMFDASKREVVVGASTAARYKDAQIGRKLTFGRGEWEVVGIFRTPGSGSSEIWAPFNPMRADFDDTSGSSSLLVRAVSEPAMRDLMRAILANQQLNLNAVSEKEYWAKQTQGGEPLKYLGWLVAVVMAIGSAFAATNTMYAAVSRRTREIGTLRALGFGRWLILFSFVTESIFLALIGGVLGVLLALPLNGWATGVGNFVTFTETTFQLRIGPWEILAGLTFAAAIGLVGGFLPAWAAARKNMIQAMREI